MWPSLLLIFLHLFHPFYVSVTEIEQNQKHKTVQVSVRIFFDDFEKALDKKYKVKVNILNPTDRKQLDLLMAGYIKEHLKINANGKNLELKYQGYEIEEDAAWCYFETAEVASVKELKVKNDILFEQHAAQSNMIHAIVNGLRKSTKLDNPKSQATFSY
jgi:HSP20 family molecular chaperone IbpA